MRQCEEVARIAYEAFARELKKGKSPGQAMKDAFEAGAPRVFITYERARRLISDRHKTGQYPCRHKHMINILEMLYQWWLANPKGKERGKWMRLCRRMDEPAMWPVGFSVFSHTVYKYMRGEFSGKRKYF